MRVGFRSVSSVWIHEPVRSPRFAEFRSRSIEGLALRLVALDAVCLPNAPVVLGPIALRSRP